MSQTPLFEEIRAAAAWVADRAQDVHLDEKRLSSFADVLAARPDFEPTLDPLYHYVGYGDATVAYVLCLDAINFGSGWFPWLVRREGLAGYFTLAAGLKESFEAEGPPTTAQLLAMEGRICARIFGQLGAPPPVGELMERFAVSWRELGRFVGEHFAGDFAALVAAADHSAHRLVEILRRMPTFDDVAFYEGRTVPFYKRAQLTAVDLHLALEGRGAGRFEDLDRLTLFADNQVPQVLRNVGVLELSETLAARIGRGEEIAAGSPEEVEIRAVAVHAVERLADEMARRGVRRSAWELDQLLWQRGLELAADSFPAHRTRTVFY